MYARLTSSCRHPAEAELDRILDSVRLSDHVLLTSSDCPSTNTDRFDANFFSNPASLSVTISLLLIRQSALS